MGDMKDKFKGFMKKVNNQLNTSSSGKFKGQGRVLGSSSSSSGQFVSSQRNPNPNSANSSVNLKPLSHKSSISEPTVKKPIPEGQNESNPNLIMGSVENRPNVEGFDPYGSLITTVKRNKNGFSLNVFECPICNCGFGSEDEVSLQVESCLDETNKC